MTFIKEHKTGVIIGIVVVLLLFLILYAVFGTLFSSSSTGVYGDRLMNAEVIEDSVITTIKNDLQSNSFVNSVEYKQNIRILKFFINVSSGTEIDKVKEIVDTIPTKLGSKVSSYYDIEIFVTSVGESNEYPAIGYLFKNSTDFSWSGAGVGE